MVLFQIVPKNNTYQKHPNHLQTLNIWLKNVTVLPSGDVVHSCWFLSDYFF